MKRILFFLALWIPVSGYAQMPVASETLDLRVLKFEQEGDNVVVQLAMDVDGRRVGTKERWEVTPMVEAVSDTVELPPIVVSGRSRANMFRRAQRLGHNNVDYGAPDPLVYEMVRRGEGRSVVYSVTLPWQPWMADASLGLHSKLIACGNGLYWGDERLAGVVAGVAVPVTEVYSPRVSYVAPVREEVKRRTVVKSAYIDFRVNESVVVPSLGRNALELAAIEASIAEVLNYPDFTYRGILLTGYASPEGPYANNDRLASERVNAVRSYVSSHFDVDPHTMSTAHVAEDWKGLRAKVEHSNLPDKSEVLRIIDTYRSADDREAALKRFASGAPWRVILRDMMPSLRRTEYRVDYSVRDYELDESRKIVKANPDRLSYYELDALARDCDPKSKEYADIYNLIEIQNLTDDAANINVASNYILHGNWKAATAALERIKTRDAAYWNNYGIVQMMTGNPAAAAEAFRLSGTTDAQYNARMLAAGGGSH